MAKKELIKIDTYKGEQPNSKVYVLSMDVSGMGIYEKAKAITRFITKETKVLEQVIESDLRQVLRENGITIEDGSGQALEKALILLESQGKYIDIKDRYYEIGNERIIGESENFMTIIQEDNLISCAMEVTING